MTRRHRAAMSFVLAAVILVVALVKGELVIVSAATLLAGYGIGMVEGT